MSNPTPRVPFEELWKLNPRGWIGRARTAWLQLSDTQTRAAKSDLETVLQRGPLPEGFDYAATHFAMIRLGQPAAPILAPTRAPVQVPTRVFIRENTPEWRAWQRHLGRSVPVDNRGGWWFPSRLPPLEAAPLDTAPAKVAHSISHDGGRHLLCAERDDARDRRKTKEIWE
jgi:hypothetical protein